MKPTFEVKDYFGKSENLIVDNDKAKLTDFQIETLRKIRKNNKFLSFHTFDFLERDKEGYITVKWNVRNNKTRKLVVGKENLKSTIIEE